ncbi:hypothetical protein OnM2_041067 [Erysiphe neolycopersici]|uniref:Uncharacterized protein n=1 Tax=Erysiphe neolycopersici TaxID=212602 RepID=A0A420HVL7_9PEZI|nr:hypothetical protein OnM2_041067 [Erysiphe neolycopersici]
MLTTAPREVIIVAWIDQYFHCGNTTTKCIDRAHLRLNDWISGFLKDSKSVINACRLAIPSQLNEIDLIISFKLSTTSLALISPKHHHYIGQTSYNGLGKLRLKFDLLRDEASHSELRNHASICRILFIVAYGILCWNKFELYFQENWA